MMTAIVSIPSNIPNRRAQEAVFGTEARRNIAMSVVRDAMYDFGDMTRLHYRTGVSLSALHAIRSGRTLWPRPHTLFSLMHVLGLELTIRKRS